MWTSPPEYAKESDIEDTIRKLGYTVRDRNKVERFKQEEEELQKSKKTFWDSTYAAFAGLIILAIFKLDQFLSIYLIIPPIGIWILLVPVAWDLLFSDSSAIETTP